ncbi:MAG: SPOR domain-containing protein [Chitinophagales bacterium]
MEKYNEINKLIKELLRSQDCVVIPGFGAFICTTESSRIDKKTNFILPPQRVISFNRSLQRNDAILTKQYAAQKPCSYAAALVEIDLYVNHIKTELEKNKTYTIPEIGSFQLENEGRLVFKSTDVSIQPLESYGLRPVHIAEPVTKQKETAPVEQEAKTAVATETPTPKTFLAEKKEKREKRKTEKSEKNQSRKYALGFVIAALILLSQLVLWDIHPKGLELSSLNLLNFNPIEHSEILSKEKAEVTATALKPDFEVQSYIAIPEISDASIDQGYYIVLGAFSKWKYANRLGQKLKNSGFEAELIRNENNLIRVAVPVGAFQENAVDNLTFFKSAWNEQAWLLENRI